ncbi:hypothetical protein ACIA71_38395 [Streptomyces anulatus]
MTHDADAVTPEGTYGSRVTHSVSGLVSESERRQIGFGTNPPAVP